MDYEFYIDFLEEDSPEVEDRDLEIFAEEYDIDIWAEYELDVDGEKYRLNITEDASPNSGNANYTVKISEKKGLNIGEGFTDWRKTFEREYNRVKAAGFRGSLKQDLVREISVDLDIQQTQL